MKTDPFPHRSILRFPFRSTLRSDFRKMRPYPVLIFLAWFLLGSVNACHSPSPEATRGGSPPFMWDNANVYFLLTDRFSNGDPSNDLNFNRTLPTGPMRGFEGGDLQGVIRKLEEGYFQELGITALWVTPFFEQDHGATDEGTGITYGYHGYWIQDWTRLDPNFGTMEELQKLVEMAHRQGIRILMDVVMNHTGPVTDQDPVWPVAWVRTSPPCTFQSYETTVSCTLVKNLPDIRTGSDQAVELPSSLLQKWEAEGRLEQEMAELEDFFERTGYPRAPRYYLIKWLTDFVRKYGIDGYRLDTAKHIEESVWAELFGEAQSAFEAWKRDHPEEVLDDNDFFMVGEVYGYGISSGRYFSFGDRQVDFYAQHIHSLINFQFKVDAALPYEELFSRYSEMLHGTLEGVGVLNYISSHDDGSPFDIDREMPLEALSKLLLAPGASQIYYGDESGRDLRIPGALGDANLRGPMNWDEIEAGAVKNGFPVTRIMDHAGKLGRFRRDHPSVGAGIHRKISDTPYLFSRILEKEGIDDRVVVGLDLAQGDKRITVESVFPDGATLYDYYSDSWSTVKKGKVTISSEYPVVLLAERNTRP
ncbi:MAG: alpha-amylase family glycosyl hydrolase [Bacteroidales bacterium]